MNAQLEDKVTVDHHDQHDAVESKGDDRHATQAIMKSSLDRLSVFQAMRVYKRVVLIAMMAAFSASLDGYRMFILQSLIDPD